MSEPLVSVLITSYNRQAFIAEAIESVLISSFSNFELVIVDDNSNDDTFTIAEKYAANDKRIRLFKNQKNIGQFGNRNRAANLATGEYLIYVDSDDIMNKDAIERCMVSMISHPEVGFAMFQDSSENNFIVLKSNEAIRKHFFEKPFLTHGPGATIIKRSVFQEIGGFPLKYSVAGDMYYNLNAASHVNVLLLPYRVVNYRVHAGQELNNRYDYLWANYNYLHDALKELPLPLTGTEKQWLMNKNRRRFLVNVTYYFFQSFDLPRLCKLLTKTNFRFSDLFKAIFHKNI